MEASGNGAAIRRLPVPGNTVFNLETHLSERADGRYSAFAPVTPPSTISKRAAGRSDACSRRRRVPLGAIQFWTLWRCSLYGPRRMALIPRWVVADGRLRTGWGAVAGPVLRRSGPRVEEGTGSGCGVIEMPNRPDRELSPIFDVKFPEDSVHVLFNGSFGEAKLECTLFMGSAWRTHCAICVSRNVRVAPISWRSRTWGFSTLRADVVHTSGELDAI